MKYFWAQLKCSPISNVINRVLKLIWDEPNMRLLPVKLTWTFGYESLFSVVVLTTVLLLNQLLTMTWFSEGLLVRSSSDGVVTRQPCFSPGGLKAGGPGWHWGNGGGGNVAAKLGGNCCEGMWCEVVKCGGTGGGGITVLGWLNHGGVGGRGGGGTCVPRGYKDPGCTFLWGNCLCDPWCGNWFIMIKVGFLI